MSKFLRIKNKISQEKMKKSRKLVLQTLGAWKRAVIWSIFN